MDEVDEVFDRDVSFNALYSSELLTSFSFECAQAEIYNIERSDWTIDKASDQRMVYVPKDTVIEFMKKVSVSN